MSNQAGFDVQVKAPGWELKEKKTEVASQVQLKGDNEAKTLDLGAVKRWRKVIIKYQGPDINQFVESEIIIPRPGLWIEADELLDGNPDEFVASYYPRIEAIRKGKSKGKPINPLAQLGMYQMDRQSFPETIKVEKIEKREFNGHPGIYLEYTSLRNKVPFRQIAIFTASKKFVIKFLLWVPDQYWNDPQYGPDVQAIVSSFRVTN